MSETTYPNELVDPDVLATHEEHALLRGAPWQRFAVIGDSIAEGIGDPVDGYRTLDWSRRVARGLRAHHRDLSYLNLGSRGLRAAEVRDRQLSEAVLFAPDLTAVCAGANDAMARLFDAGALEAELDTIVGTLRDAGSDVLLFTLFDVSRAITLPDPYGTRLGDRMATLTLITRAVADRHGAMVADCAAHPRAADPSIYSADLLHLNMRGHAIAAAAAMQTLGAAAAGIEPAAMAW
ncbi:MAG TPA: SGNH/GDSL hydrolase family protein [Conexibacter sp.]|jgi:lysophospholipase L1-like esterase